MKTGMNASIASPAFLPLVAIIIFHSGIVFIIDNLLEFVQKRVLRMTVALLIYPCYTTIVGFQALECSDLAILSD